MAALFFLAFAFFAVGQATSLRNSAQTAADAAALAAARADRDAMADQFLAALTGGDVDALKALLDGADRDPVAACAAASEYAADNDAAVVPGTCDSVSGPPGYQVEIVTDETVGNSAVDGTENLPAHATATAVIEPRCTVGDKTPSGITFTCDDTGIVTIDPSSSDFQLNLAEFFSIHLSE